MDMFFGIILILAVGVPLCLLGHKKGWLPNFPCGCGSIGKRLAPEQKKDTTKETGNG